ncbi:hypothetical protein DO97_08485 [Neosynechococcus sphagnicola sy1]|uniref:Type II secretion system protein GspE N-terminal domain-containing protein n=2 Tax=Neosynechococcus TaxID=1501143 RepID=A0A098TKP1_9CYAN|nr:hypothetical protein DO97_08485 [Neosynechococcus sphagnicola sy1]
MVLNQSRLGELLIHRKLISTTQLEQALAQQHSCQKPLGELLVEMNFVSSEQLERVLAEQNFRKSGFWIID